MENLLLNVFGISKKINISFEGKSVIEIIIFKHVCSELRKYFNQEYEKTNRNLVAKESYMADGQMIGKLVNDLLSEDEYSIEGLAEYTGYPLDVIYDLASGINCNPTIELSNKIIELHFFARRDLYFSFIKKIM